MSNSETYGKVIFESWCDILSDVCRRMRSIAQEFGNISIRTKMQDIEKYSDSAYNKGEEKFNDAPREIVQLVLSETGLFEILRKKATSNRFHESDLRKLRKILSLTYHNEFTIERRPSIIKADLEFVSYLALELNCDADVLGKIDVLRQKLTSTHLDIDKHILPFDDLLKNVTDFVGRREWLNQLIKLTTMDHRRNHFIFGEMGIGKTAFACKFYFELSKMANVVVAAHFVRGGGVNCTVTQIIASLLAQVAKKNEWPVSQPISNPKELIDSIQPSLETVVREKLKSVVFLIDGFDELPDSEQDEIFKVLNVLGDKGIHLFLFSRKTKFLEDISPVLELKYEDEQNVRDLSEYINARIDNCKLEKTQKKLKQNKAFILAKVCGQFQYAKVIVDGLLYDKIDEEKLDSLPKEMQLYYQMTYDRVLKSYGNDEDKFIRECIPILAVLAIVPEGIQVKRLADITELNQVLVTRCLRNIIDLLDVSKEGPKENSNSIELADKIELTHFSLWQFLLTQYYVRAAIPGLASKMLSDVIQNRYIEESWQEAEYYSALSGDIELTSKLFAETNYLHHLITNCSDENWKKWEVDKPVVFDRDEFYYRVRHLFERCSLYNNLEPEFVIYKRPDFPWEVDGVLKAVDKIDLRARLYLLGKLFSEEFYKLADADSESINRIEKGKPNLINQWKKYILDDDYHAGGEHVDATMFSDSEDFLRDFFAQDDNSLMKIVRERFGFDREVAQPNWKAFWKTVELGERHLFDDALAKLFD